MIEELLTNHIWFVYLTIALYSLSIGSFLNVLIYRLPHMMQREWRSDCCELLHIPNASTPGLNLFLPRSFCPACKNPIAMWQNIPLVSYIILRGKCFYCKNKVSLRYPLIELLTMMISIQTFWFYGWSLQCLCILLCVWILTALLFIDLDWQLLPDCLTLGLLWIGLIVNSFELFIPLKEAVWSAAGAYLFLWVFIKIFYFLTGKVGMGNGDFKLFAAFGALLGWKLLPLILLFSSIAGTVGGLIYLYVADQSKNTPIPFGPFLCLGAYGALFWGNKLLNWYLSIWM